ncbi:c13orf37, related protein [Toxoplasma gondii MAS]|uniref:C13orf37, related protein n=1 Tax=Toxoplasma gondii MAS TaxID=943118 RepID=A0A086PL56_TOXGO|nr:c13orf37, related protein [Toxoplasma gondii MAS]
MATTSSPEASFLERARGGNDDGDGQETMEILMEISTLLDTGLDRATLQILVELVEQGVHPEALSRVVLEMRRELQAVREKEERSERNSPIKD